MDPCAFDPKNVSGTVRTKAGRFVRDNAYRRDSKNEYSFGEMSKINENHTPDVIVKRISHLVYEGGLWNVPMDSLSEFNDLRASDLRMNQY